MRTIAVISTALLAIGCGRKTDVAAPLVAPEASAARTGLSAVEQQTFYHLDEGSELLPVSWFLALDNERGTGLFAENLERFGFLTDAKSATNPYGLAVGLTAAATRDVNFAGVEMVGVNCAACHVGEVTTPSGKHVRVDGAPARLDTIAFFHALAASVLRTVDWRHPERFAEFLSRIGVSSVDLLDIAGNTTPPHTLRFDIERAALGTGVQEPAATAVDQTEWQRLADLLRAEELREPLDLSKTLALKADAAGTAARQRLAALLGVAFPQAQNSPVTILRLLRARLEFLIRLAGTRDPGGVPAGFGRLDAFGGARNLLWQDDRPAAAPVSYPDLWSFEKLPWVHWDANTTSVLERNIGQALGVGAIYDSDTLTSTVSVVNLHRLEVLAAKIRPPRWTDVFGPIDMKKAERGGVIFKEQCAGCHESRIGELIPNEQLGGIDPNRALNFGIPINGRPTDQVIADLIGRIKRKAFAEKGFTKADQQLLENGRPALWRVPKQYAVPPLVGVWATAPYLHNNSVPTLRDLLTEESRRPQSFHVGRTDYDLEKMGFVSTDDGKGRFFLNTAVPGNRNTGHAFGTRLKDSEKINLLEYLKLF